MANATKTVIKSEEIDGFEIRYERESGETWAVGYCPICGKEEQSVQRQADAGIITAGKLNTRMKVLHGTENPN